MMAQEEKPIGNFFYQEMQKSKFNEKDFVKIQCFICGTEYWREGEMRENFVYTSSMIFLPSKCPCRFVGMKKKGG